MDPPDPPQAGTAPALPIGAVLLLIGLLMTLYNRQAIRAMKQDQ